MNTEKTIIKNDQKGYAQIELQTSPLLGESSAAVPLLL